MYVHGLEIPITQHNMTQGGKRKSKGRNTVMSAALGLHKQPYFEGIHHVKENVELFNIITNSYY